MNSTGISQESDSPAMAGGEGTHRFPPRRVLAPTDFSARSLRAVGFAEGLARRTGAVLVLLHVAEPIAYPADLGYAPVLPGEVEVELQAAARKRLDELVAGLQARGMTVEGVLRSGRPYGEITEGARDLGADLITLTTHGFTGLKHVLLGSTAERVVRQAPCPIWVLREPAPAGADEAVGAAAVELRRILVAVDFSAHSLHALEYATTVATHFGAELSLVHVIERPVVDPAMAEVDGSAFEEQSHRHAQSRLDELAATGRHSGLKVSHEIASGVPWHEVVEFAGRTGPDLIVVGTHGYTGLRHVLLGSTAERVVRHATRPVLVVRAAAP